MARTRIIKQVRHGQITIPREFREAMGLEPDDLLSVTLGDENRLEIMTVQAMPKGPGSPWLRDLYDLFAPAREGLKDLTEDEVNAEIDAALKEVRAARKRRR